LAPHPPEDKQIGYDKISNKYISLAGRLWENNFTPQKLLRAAGPWGPSQVHKITMRRFGSERWAPEDSKLVSDYLYQMSSLPGSGEYALNSVLTPIVSLHTDDPASQRPRVYAREPVTPEHFKHFARSGAVAAAEGEGASPSPMGGVGVPLLILYGDNDWIAFPEAKDYVKELRSKYGVDAELNIIENAGHHLYMDNADDLHGKIDTWLARTRSLRESNSSAVSGAKLHAKLAERIVKDLVVEA
jgi:cardiolipin-specific phospholipase